MARSRSLDGGRRGGRRSRTTSSRARAARRRPRRACGAASATSSPTRGELVERPATAPGAGGQASSRRGARVLVLGVERPSHRELAARDRTRELRALAPRGRAAHGGAGRARQVREPQPAARRRTRRRTRLAARVDDDVELPRGFLDRFVFLCERFSLHARAAGAPAALARRVAADAPACGQRGARDALRRDRAGDGVRARDVRDAAAVSAAAHGLGAGRALGGARRRARLALRRDRRGRDRPRDSAAAADATRARQARGRGARVPRRAALRDGAPRRKRTLATHRRW